jgi:hypothetical protein
MHGRGRTRIIHSIISCMTLTTQQAHVFLVLAAILALLATPSFSLAAQPEYTDGFVCPVFNSASAVGAHNPNAVEIAGGDYTIVGPNVRIPVLATNGNGAGSPGGAHSAPGDSDYTAIWSGN